MVGVKLQIAMRFLETWNEAHGFDRPWWHVDDVDDESLRKVELVRNHRVRWHFRRVSEVFKTVLHDLSALTARAYTLSVEPPADS